MRLGFLADLPEDFDATSLLILSYSLFGRLACSSLEYDCKFLIKIVFFSHTKPAKTISSK